MKRTPVLIDVNGVPLRESLSYNGGGAGFGGQMAEWLPPAQSADAALLPALRLGNARADDLVRNNGIAANAVALHKDHIVGHMFLISYRPNWRWLGMRERGIPISPASRWCSGQVSRSRHRRRDLNPPAPRRCWVRK
ncbi:phage portal protein [Escherichia coli]|nr:phage portal protein [Escherichia coli]